MKKEKSLFLLIFTLFFLLSGSLLYLMIKKDVDEKDRQVARMAQPSTNNTPENVWPKVEIKARQ